MPWKVFKNENGKFVVRKLDSSGDPIGDPLGTHDTEAEATAQQRALYAAENRKSVDAVKFADLAETEIEGLGMPFGGPFNGADLAGERFSAKTDFAFDWFDERPLLYHHGLDGAAGISVVGRVKSWETKADLGVWTKAQLDASSEYFGAIKDLIKAGKLYFSSGSMRHLVDVGKAGEVKRWPWIELSLTPTPCNLYAEIDFASAQKHYQAAGIKADLSALKLDSSDMPEMGKKPMPMPMMRQMVKKMAADMEVDMSDSEMETMMADMEGMGEDEAKDHAKKKMSKMAQKTVSPDDPMSLTVHAEMTKAFAAGLVERTKDLRERRIKEGRIISAGNRKKLSECLDSMRTACDSMQTLLDATEPPAKAGDVERAKARLQILRLYTATLN